MNWRVLAGQTFVQVVADITGRKKLNFLRNVIICPIHMLVNKILDSSVSLKNWLLLSVKVQGGGNKLSWVRCYILDRVVQHDCETECSQMEWVCGICK